MGHFLNWWLLGPLVILLTGLAFPVVWFLYVRHRTRQQQEVLSRLKSKKALTNPAAAAAAAATNPTTSLNINNADPSLPTAPSSASASASASASTVYVPSSPSTSAAQLGGAPIHAKSLASDNTDSSSSSALLPRSASTGTKGVRARTAAGSGRVGDASTSAGASHSSPFARRAPPAAADWLSEDALASEAAEAAADYDHVEHADAIGFLAQREMSFDIRFEELGLKLQKSDRKVLDGVTGHLKPGRLTAVMGPSGSGKTTFLTTLAGRANYGVEQGVIFINDIRDSLRRYKNLVGFVPQEDVMMRVLTVEENLMFSALTRLPRDLTYKQKLAMVENVMALLGLSEIRFSVIGDEDVRGISGGQRKRVNIGIEMVADPSVLFLDEPTSGLDSTSSKEVCGCLQRLAKTGLTIAAVIHQPRYEIFEMLDDVLLLGKGGRTVFLGPSKDALPYFESIGFQCPPRCNPGDFLMDIIAGEISCDGQPDFQPSDLFAAWTIRQEKDKALAAARRPSSTSSIASAASRGAGHGTVAPASASAPAAVLSMASPVGNTHSSLGSMDNTARGDFHSNADFSQEESRIGGLDDGLDDMENADEFDPLLLPGRGFDLQHQGVVTAKGTRQDFVKMLVLCTAIPIAIPYALYRKPRTRRAAAGGMIGASLGVFLVFLFISAAFFVGHCDTGNQETCISGGVDAYLLVQYAFIAMAVVCFVLLVTSVVWVALKKDPFFLGHLVAGVTLGPFFMGWVWRRPDVAPSTRYASVVGFGGFVVCIGLLLLNADYGFTLWSYFALGLVPLTGITMLVVFALRYRRLPTFDRDTPSFFYMVYQVAKRALVQTSRNWTGVAFDVGLMFGSGTFMGVIYYDRYYQPPLIDELFPSGNCTGLPEIVCTFLQLPQDDPIPSEASLTCLSIALSAVASSLRVFGNESVVFKRESAAALSTEAYYVGKTLGHFPIVFLAPLTFTFCYYSLVQPLAPFWQYFLLFFLVYFACAGLAYLVSVLVPRDMSQLVGVLAILVFMMFSGSSPNLQQLKDNNLIPNVLVYPTYLSLFRFSQEAYYLIEIAPFNTNPVTMSKFYDYSQVDWVECWVMMGWLALLFRLLAYIFLVRKEE